MWLKRRLNRSTVKKQILINEGVCSKKKIVESYFLYVVIQIIFFHFDG